jgi:hypothetical protein
MKKRFFVTFFFFFLRKKTPSTMSDFEAGKGYIKVASHEAHKGTFDKCLLLYSGGLDTSVMLKWIQDEYNCKVYCLTINLGQTADDLDVIDLLERCEGAPIFSAAAALFLFFPFCSDISPMKKKNTNYFKKFKNARRRSRPRRSVWEPPMPLLLTPGTSSPMSSFPRPSRPTPTIRGATPLVARLAGS